MEGYAFMSKYEDYQRTSQHYDDTRVVIGVEILLGALATSGTALHEQVVLDAGCGTGAYLSAIRPYVSALIGVDLNEGMLDRAQEKFGPGDAVRLEQGSVTELPLDDASADGVMCNQVVHHLDGADAHDAHPGLLAFIAEAHRVLRPGGTLCLNTCHTPQVRDGYWWMELIPAARDRAAKRFVPLDSVERALARQGFQNMGRFVPTDGLLQGDAYGNPEGPFDRNYRDGDSTWAHATAEELSSGLEHLREMCDDGSVDGFMAERERKRLMVGQISILVARKAI
jgi:ubiquinone/menaquinone biosynthesis C-methylase UbiE